MKWKSRRFFSLLAALAVAGGALQIPAAAEAKIIVVPADTSSEAVEEDLEGESTEPVVQVLVVPLGQEEPEQQEMVVETKKTAAKASSPVEDSYFDDVIFVGDSITLKLKKYVEKQRQKNPGLLGEAQFLAAGGLGSGNALMEISSITVHPVFNGEKTLIEDGVAASGAKRVYMMFGLNDIGRFGVENSIANLNTLVGRILQQSPDVEFIFQSTTPILTDKQQKKLNNANIEKYNQRLQEYCEENGFTFLDVASVFKDEDGGLIRSYCGDAAGLGMHLLDSGCRVWIDYLRSNPVL